MRATLVGRLGLPSHKLRPNQVKQGALLSCKYQDAHPFEVCVSFSLTKSYIIVGKYTGKNVILVRKSRGAEGGKDRIKRSKLPLTLVISLV